MLFLIEVHLEYLSFEVKKSLMLQRFYIGSAKGNKETKKNANHSGLCSNKQTVSSGCFLKMLQVNDKTTTKN